MTKNFSIRLLVSNVYLNRFLCYRSTILCFIVILSYKSSFSKSGDSIPSCNPLYSIELHQFKHTSAEEIDISHYTQIYDDTFSNHSSFNTAIQQKFTPLSQFKISKYHKDIFRISQWLQFQLCNNGQDTIHGFYFCGRHNRLRLISMNRIESVQYGGWIYYFPDKPALFPTYYLPFSIAPHSSQRFVVQLENYGIVPSRIVSKITLRTGNPNLYNITNTYYYTWLVISCLVCGGILVLGLFNLLQFISNRRKEYFYYGCYAFMIFFSIERACEWQFELRMISQLIPNYFSNTATVFNVLSGIFYLLFTRHFLDIHTNNSFINKVIQVSICLLSIGVCILILGILTEYSSPLTLMLAGFLSMTPILLTTFVAVLIWLYKRQDPLSGYLLLGYLFLFMGAGTNIYINNFGRHLISNEMPPIIFLELGVILELVLFALGLGYKVRLIEKQKQASELMNLQQKLEHELQINNVRFAISRDLHDDIGSTLSSINILSRTAQRPMQDGNDEKKQAALEKISERSQRLLSSMNDIIWNINPGNDTADELLSRIREYATAVLEAKSIEYSFIFNVTESMKLPMQLKSNFYLVCKEAVNNLIKYSGCTKAIISLSIDDTIVTLGIEDNGQGFDIDSLKHKGGLLNMQHRANEMKGDLHIQSEIGKGTKVSLVVRY
jgi:signal transduction histidine kinase